MPVDRLKRETELEIHSSSQVVTVSIDTSEMMMVTAAKHTTPTLSLLSICERERQIRTRFADNTASSGTHHKIRLKANSSAVVNTAESERMICSEVSL